LKEDISALGEGAAGIEEVVKLASKSKLDMNWAQELLYVIHYFPALEVGQRQAQFQTQQLLLPL
jgi:hypothetical protein